MIAGRSMSTRDLKVFHQSVTGRHLTHFVNYYSQLLCDELNQLTSNGPIFRISSHFFDLDRKTGPQKKRCFEPLASIPADPIAPPPPAETGQHPGPAGPQNAHRPHRHHAAILGGLANERLTVVL
jgi:hypothetical protein